MIHLKRAYETPTSMDGERVLVERLWPRGLTTRKAAVDLWKKEVAPRPVLRKWFAHDPAKLKQFERRCWRELRRAKEPVALLRRKARHGTVTLVYAERDHEHDGAPALKEFLERR